LNRRTGHGEVLYEVWSATQRRTYLREMPGGYTKLGRIRRASVTNTIGADAAAPNRSLAQRNNQEWVYLAGIKTFNRAGGRCEEK
jgi:hypothetical protein